MWPVGAKIMHFRGRQKSAPPRDNVRPNTRETVRSSERKIQTTVDRFLSTGTSSVQAPTTIANVTIRKKKQIQPWAENDHESDNDHSVRLSESESESNISETDNQIENSAEEAIDSPQIPLQ